MRGRRALLAGAWAPALPSSTGCRSSPAARLTRPGGSGSQEADLEQKLLRRSERRAELGEIDVR